MSVYKWAHQRWRALPEGWRRFCRTSPLLLRSLRGIRNVLTRLSPHDDVYDREWYEALDREFAEGQNVMADSFLARFRPASVADVGCGTGALLHRLKQGGVRVFGLERSEAALAICRQRELEVQTVNLLEIGPKDAARYPGPFDLVLSFEVLEHLPPDRAASIVGFLCALGPRIVFSAAQPGQGGHDHLNEQPLDYWIRLFDEAGHPYDADGTEGLKTEWSQSGKVSVYYRRNTLVFQRRDASV